MKSLLCCFYRFYQTSERFSCDSGFIQWKSKCQRDDEGDDVFNDTVALRKVESCDEGNQTEAERVT